MPFKGVIRMGSKVTVELKVAGSAGGHALASLSYVDEQRNGGVDSKVISPGRTDSCVMSTTSNVPGYLRVWVDFNRDTDRGDIVVRAGSAVVSQETIMGDTIWAYALA